MADLKLTPSRKKKLLELAKSAERMAKRCEKGTAKNIGKGQCFLDGKASCVFGHVIQSAFPDFKVEDTIEGNDVALATVLRLDTYELPKQLENLISNITGANDKASSNARLQKRVVKPLRLFATKVTEAVNAKKVWDDADDLVEVNDSGFSTVDSIKKAYKYYY